MFDIIRSKVESDRITDFVAIGNFILRPNSLEHSAFVIQYQNSLYEFHYYGNVQLTPIIRDYYHKITDTIEPREVPAFLAFCQQIAKKANPGYGFFLCR